MSSLSQLANRLTSGLSSVKISNTSGINIPTLSWLDSSIEPVSGLSWVQSSGSVIQALTNGAKGVYCMGVILSDPSQLLKMGAAVLQYIEAWGIGLLNDLYRVCIDRINAILLESYGVVVSVFKAIAGIISFVKELYTLYKNIKEAWKKRNEAKEEAWMKREDCAFFVANILRCMIGRLIEPYITNFKQKATKEIEDVYSDVSNTISDRTETLRTVSNYVEQQSMFATKFVEQLNHGLF